uniref:Uncharacterized protein n=1 Tax=Oryzias latipes TaxID=8090 RepID=A0A3B3HTG7_ORYLA
PGHLPKVLASLCVQMRSHLPWKWGLAHMHIWDQLNQRLDNCTPPPSDLEELYVALVEEVARSMRCCSQAVIAIPKWPHVLLRSLRVP